MMYYDFDLKNAQVKHLAYASKTIYHVKWLLTTATVGRMLKEIFDKYSVSRRAAKKLFYDSVSLEHF